MKSLRCVALQTNYIDRNEQCVLLTGLSVSISLVWARRAVSNYISILSFLMKFIMILTTYYVI